MTQLQTLKGFRDFLPAQKRQRDFVMQKITQAFAQSNFEPLETPTLEYKETIMGKYGDEADKLVYQFRDNGDREVALRYDQTVPTARVIAQYQQELGLPFRRYQTQNVFRADKPQKGRYREFTQCDIDIFGSTEPMADAEILATTYAAYKNIGFPEVELRVNDRQVLFSTLEPFATKEVSVFSLIQSIDKLDKATPVQIIDELKEKGLSRESASAALLAIQSAKPSENLSQIMSLAEHLGVEPRALVFTPTIARGLDYYTGMIFEVIIPGFTVGSVGGGGRYDKLISELSGQDIPAVGMAFGFDRTVDAAVELGILNTEFKEERVLVTIFSEELINTSAAVTSELRQAGISAELYTNNTALGKQLKYANKKGFTWVVVIGPDEAVKEAVQLKNLESGEQTTVERVALTTTLKK
jgi:histidyl-tRNA synthetase